ncbi:CGP-CTERM sorting domain-containing protein [Rhizobium straminoryzae]|uniref:CGP-CTERM sorting domain-containing protein n=1 Tax=Rhizobium straminoryzae TaxID=1387186 RepID=A0A549T936_9HYPH|nr:CGP-CTERM sorting domain-containing protein [Rhizobium straminoryzae]
MPRVDLICGPAGLAGGAAGVLKLRKGCARAWCRWIAAVVALRQQMA